MICLFAYFNVHYLILLSMVHEYAFFINTFGKWSNFIFIFLRWQREIIEAGNVRPSRLHLAIWHRRQSIRTIECDHRLTIGHYADRTSYSSVREPPSIAGRCSRVSQHSKTVCTLSVSDEELLNVRSSYLATPQYGIFIQ